MRYIENMELREWVKDNLRKTIFQKAHALAVQTGCEILVKLQDTGDITGCQYYATSNLKKLYRNSKLRRPGEMLVSGETGTPLVDKCTQSCDDDNTSEQIPGHASGHLPDGSTSETLADDATHPMELTESSEEFVGEDATEDVQDQSSQFESSTQGEDTYGTGSGVQIKTEMVETECVQEQFTTLVEEELDTKTGLTTLDLDLPLEAGTSTSMPSTLSCTTTMPTTILYPNVQRYAVPISPKPYQCSICQKTFRSIQILQKHTLTFHSRPRSTMPLTKAKGKGWAKGHGLQYFRQPTGQVDLEPKSYHCVMCNHSFSSPELLQEHVTKGHMGILVPPQQDPTSQQQSTDNLGPSFMPLELKTSEHLGASMSQLRSPENPSFNTSQNPPDVFNQSAASTSSAYSPSASPSSTQRRGTVAKSGEQPHSSADHPVATRSAAQHVCIRMDYGTRNWGRKCLWCKMTKNLTKSGKLVQTRFGCNACAVHLCKGLCFTRYHSHCWIDLIDTKTEN